MLNFLIRVFGTPLGTKKSFETGRYLFSRFVQNMTLRALGHAI